jgi:hypothetical protein
VRHWPAAVTGLFALLLFGAAPRAQPTRTPDLDVFVSRGCPHCAAAEPFIARLRQERPDLVIRVREVGDSAVRRELVASARLRGITALGVPAFLVGGQLIIGYDESGRTESEVRSLLPPARPDVVAPGVPPPLTTGPETDVVELPLLGPLRASRIGLPLFSLVVGFVDGVNPCAMWALLYILTLLATLNDRRRMFLIGGTFVAVGGLLYFAFIAAWLELFLLIGLSRSLQVALGTAAVLAATVHVKDAVAWGHGPSLSIPSRAKPVLFRQARRILNAENLAGALIAVAVLSALVNVVELLCTAGLPAVYTQVLASHDLSRLAYYGNLSLYIGAYVLDDAVVLGAAIVTLSHHRLQERAGRWLKLLSGVVLLILGLVLLIRPDWLT